MHEGRRTFVKAAAVAGAGVALSRAIPGTLAAGPAKKPAKPGSKILILGGTGFLGPKIVEAALADGHTVTLFNRGKTHPGLFPDLEKLRGDRNGDLKALEGRDWDCVVDTSGYLPRQVKASATLLAKHVKRYLFISSLSAFAEDVPPGSKEDGPLATMPDPTNEDIAKHYGALKVLCEKAVEAALPGRAFIVRPGLIVGPGDRSDRYTYWPVRVAKGGEVLAPGDGTDPVQYVDVRDLAAFLILGLDRSYTGIYDAVGPARKTPMKTFLDEVKKGVGGDARFTWVATDFLEAQKVQPWSDLPVWVPSRGGKEGFTQFDCSKAIAAGLTFRSGEATAKDTLAWWRGLPEARRAKPRTGLSAAREAEVLAAWHAKEDVPKAS